MKLSRVRIVFSALCEFLSVSFLVLWLASYSSHIYISKRFAASIVSVQANRGELGVWTTSPLVPGPDVTWGIGGRSLETSVLEHLDAEGEPEFELFGFR